MADLSVTDLVLRLGDSDILRGVSFGLARGGVAALLGPSGSGKTTLLRAIAGLETPRAGTITLDGKAMFDAKHGIDVPAERRGLGLVFQSYALWPHRTVFDNVAYGLRLRGVATAQIARRVEETLGQIGLGALARRYPHQLSGGQQQRVAIARALVYQPPVILLDEPLSNLDAKLREEARAWLRALIVSRGLSAIYVTHDQVEAMAIADSIILLKGGVIEQEGTPPALYGAPNSLFVAEFMGSNNRLDGRIVARDGAMATIDVDGTPLRGTARGPLDVGSPAAAVIRIERVRLADAPGPNRLAMDLKTPMYLGERWELVLSHGPATVRAYAPAPLPAGRHYVDFPPEDLWIFQS